MSDHTYYSDKHSRKQKFTYRIPSNYDRLPPHYGEPNYGLSDHIFRHPLSASDHIAKPCNDCRSDYSGYETSSSASDYISEPLEARSDYIASSPRTYHPHSSGVS